MEKRLKGTRAEAGSLLLRVLGLEPVLSAASFQGQAGSPLQTNGVVDCYGPACGIAQRKSGFAPTLE